MSKQTAASNATSQQDRCQRNEQRPTSSTWPWLGNCLGVESGLGLRSRTLFTGGAFPNHINKGGEIRSPDARRCSFFFGPNTFRLGKLVRLNTKTHLLDYVHSSSLLRVCFKPVQTCPRETINLSALRLNISRSTTETLLPATPAKTK